MNMEENPSLWQYLEFPAEQFSKMDSKGIENDVK
jgi:hypothetical protein